MGTADAVLDIRVTPQPNASRLVRRGIDDFASAHGVGDEDLAPFLTAIGEALANAIEHSHARGSIQVEVCVSAERIVATVQDEGVGFETPLVVDARFPDLHAERGRGLPIMRRCSDIFAIRSVPGKGTAVVLGRYLRGPEHRAVA